MACHVRGCGFKSRLCRFFVAYFRYVIHFYFLMLFFNSWHILALWIFLSISIACLLFFVVYFAIKRPFDVEKLSSYECGFNPFEDVSGRFDVRFYLVAILFIIFDLEVSFLFPWSVVLGLIGFLGFWSMFFFLFILIIGFLYELRRGSLDW